MSLKKVRVWNIALFTNINLVIVVGISFGLQLLSQHNVVLGSFLLLVVGATPLLVLELVKVLQHVRRNR